MAEHHSDAAAEAFGDALRAEFRRTEHEIGPGLPLDPRTFPEETGAYLSLGVLVFILTDQPKSCNQIDETLAKLCRKLADTETPVTTYIEGEERTANPDFVPARDLVPEPPPHRMWMSGYIDFVESRASLREFDPYQWNFIAFRISELFANRDMLEEIAGRNFLRMVEPDLRESFSETPGLNLLSMGSPADVTLKSKLVFELTEVIMALAIGRCINQHELLDAATEPDEGKALIVPPNSGSVFSVICDLARNGVIELMGREVYGWGGGPNEDYVVRFKHPMSGIESEIVTIDKHFFGAPRQAFLLSNSIGDDMAEGFGYVTLSASDFEIIRKAWKRAQNVNTDPKYLHRAIVLLRAFLIGLPEGSTANRPVLEEVLRQHFPLTETAPDKGWGRKKVARVLEGLDDKPEAKRIGKSKPTNETRRAVAEYMKDFVAPPQKNSPC